MDNNVCRKRFPPCTGDRHGGQSVGVIGEGRKAPSSLQRPVQKYTGRSMSSLLEDSHTEGDRPLA